MKWLIEELENINLLKIKNILINLNIDFLLIKVIDDELFVVDKEYFTTLDNSEQIIEDFIRSEKVFSYGSKKFSLLIKKYNSEDMRITYEDERLNLDFLKEYFGEELLNYDSETNDLFLLEPKTDVFFIRPLENNKLIDGQVMTKEQFTKLKNREFKKINSKFYNQKMFISSIKEIKEEYRFFIYNKEIIGKTSYKPSIHLDISDELIEYVEKCIQLYPLDCYVIDIALSDSGYKVIEVNNINTSGLYNVEVENSIKNIQ